MCIFWAVLFVWYVMSRSCPDRPRRGLAESALPGAATTVRLFQRVTRDLGPVLKVALRLWVAVSLLAGAGWVAVSGSHSVFLPLQSAVHFPAVVSLLCAPLLALGLGTLMALLLVTMMGGRWVP
jgi:hypothetical protein